LSLSLIVQAGVALLEANPRSQLHFFIRFLFEPISFPAQDLGFRSQKRSMVRVTAFLNG
jgi:hypothetical protein